LFVSFSYIYFIQGSVATQLKRGGIFNKHVIANFENLLTFGQDRNYYLGQMLTKFQTLFMDTVQVHVANSVQTS